MSYSALISVPFHPPQVNENELANVQKKRTIPVALACGSILLILIGIGITTGVKVSKNTISATMAVTLATTYSSTCALPLHPSYNKIGNTVVNFADPNGSDASHLQSPTCIYLDNKGYLYTGAALRGRIVIFPLPNKQENVTFADAVGYSIGNTQCLYINHRNNDLYFLDTDGKGNYRVQYSPWNGTRVEATVLFTGTHSPHVGMDLDDQLNIYVSESDRHRVIKRLSPNYNEYVVVAGDETPGSRMDQLNSPRGIYLDPWNNDLYVLDSNRIQLWPAGSTVGETLLESTSFLPKKIKRDCHGNFYTLDDRTVKLFSSILELTTLRGEILLGLATNDLSAQQSSKADSFKYPTDMYLDMKNGDLYVLDAMRNHVRKYTTSTT